MLIERYLCKTSTIEQQFILPRRLTGDTSDLVIEGRIHSTGSFAVAPAGWIWHDPRGVVSLGDVTVFDGNGTRLEARMDVSAERVRITVDGAALATAVYPVTVDPEIGTDDFRISFMGTDGNFTSPAEMPVVAHNPNADEYLVVWSGKGADGGDYEIWGQLIDGPTGAAIGSNFQISETGPPGSGTAYTAREPAVAYSVTSNEYLVAWWAGPSAPFQWEIFGQRLTAAGIATGSDDFQISFMGASATDDYSATSTALAWDSINNRYLVIWEGRDPSLGNTNQVEIFGRVLNSNGTSFSADDTRFSNVANNDPTRLALDPAVAFDSVNGRYLVVWTGDPVTDNIVEAYGQLVTAAGAEFGSDFRISDMGNSDTDPNFRADRVAVTFNSASAEYLVVWRGDDDDVTGDGPLEIFGQRVTAAGATTGTNDFVISEMGPPGDGNFNADDPAVAYSSATNEYLVVWQGDETVNNNIEIYGQRLNAAGTPIGADDFRISSAGDETNDYTTSESALVWGGDRYLIVWRADSAAGTDAEWEVYGQFFTLPSAALTQISANPVTIPPDGASASTITVQARDTAGLDMQESGGAVMLMTTLGSLSGVTDQNDGTYTATLTSNTGGTATITGTLGGVAITDNATVTFGLGPPTNVTATAQGTSQVSVTWTPSGATSYDVYRAEVIPGYSLIGSTASSPFTDTTGIQANRTYVYIVRGTKDSEVSAFSPPDAATTVVFTDPALNSSIVVKADHLRQLRTAVNAMRTAANLPAATFTDDPVIAFSTIIKAVHLNQLRNNLDAARNAIGMPAIPYTESITASTTIVKGAHFTELRQGTQ